MKNKGFTIVETLVALAILIAAITGASQVAQSSLSSYEFSKNQIVAFYLAQEGFEQIRNMRDNNRLANANWLTGFASNSSDPCYFGSVCSVSPVESATASRCAGGAQSCAFLREDAATGFFGYNASWPISVYKRELSLTQISSDEVALTVTVYWSKGSINNTFKARENLFNW